MSDQRTARWAQNLYNANHARIDGCRLLHKTRIVSNCLWYRVFLSLELWRVFPRFYSYSPSLYSDLPVTPSVYIFSVDMRDDASYSSPHDSI